MATSQNAAFRLKQRIADLEKQLRDKPSFSMDRHIEALERIERLESIVRRVVNYPTMVARYQRGELSWANMINELERDIEAAMPGAFRNRLQK